LALKLLGRSSKKRFAKKRRRKHGNKNRKP
jgi:hypothetical protein